MEKLEQTPMSDKVKERIRDEAKAAAEHLIFGAQRGAYCGGYISGATAERPKAWNDAIDACIEKIKNTSAWTFADNSDRAQQIKELEALKHKQP